MLQRTYASTAVELGATFLLTKAGGAKALAVAKKKADVMAVNFMVVVVMFTLKRMMRICKPNRNFRFRRQSTAERHRSASHEADPGPRIFQLRGEKARQHSSTGWPIYEWWSVHRPFNINRDSSLAKTDLTRPNDQTHPPTRKELQGFRDLA